MYSNLHSHNYDGNTNNIFGHEHKYSGITSKDPDFMGHIHYMAGYTTEDDDHAHYYSIIMSPAINVENGHIHFYQGFTTIDSRHYHFFYGYTSIYTDY